LDKKLALIYSRRLFPKEAAFLLVLAQTILRKINNLKPVKFGNMLPKYIFAVLFKRSG
jgi:hypothetical protein